jgi:7-cyano-7-deazaguanine synthase
VSKGVVLFSGGQDSTTCLYWAKVVFDEVQALSFDYGQKHRVELDAGAAIAELAGVERAVVAVPSFAQLSDTALVGSQDIAQPDGELPTTFLPGRNLVFLSIAAGLAAERGIADIVTGICQTDYSGYPDCRDEFRIAMEQAASVGTAQVLRIHAPLMWLTKAETVRLARRLPGCWDALALSHTCYKGQRPACGECPACRLRAKGFADAGETDPACVAI